MCQLQQHQRGKLKCLLEEWQLITISLRSLWGKKLQKKYFLLQTNARLEDAPKEAAFGSRCQHA